MSTTSSGDCVSLTDRLAGTGVATPGRGQQRAAAIVPAELVERYEAMVAEDGRVAAERLTELETGRTTAIPAGEVSRALGL